MAIGFASKLASQAPIAVFPAVGRGGAALLPTLALMPEVELVSSPRHATVLLVMNDVPSRLLEQLETVHDQMPHPRATVWWHAKPLFAFRNKDIDPIIVTTSQRTDFGQQLRQVQARLFAGIRTSEPDLKPDAPPTPWRGKGDHGQGGEGMMGGTPYGRAMAMMGPDLRDGLQLDAWSFSVGPFHFALPPGLVAKVTLQGDVIQEWQVQSSPYPTALDPVFARALSQPVAVADLESARVRNHLLLLARMLQLEELEPLAYRAITLAEQFGSGNKQEKTRSCSALTGLLRKNGFLSLGHGIGSIDSHQARDFGGFVARASGASDDLRSGNDAYSALGFAPICQRNGDLQARRMQLVEEVEQSLMLIDRARKTGSVFSAEKVESPLGPLTAKQMPPDRSSLLESLLPGHEWGDAVAVIGSLRLAAIGGPEEHPP